MRIVSGSAGGLPLKVPKGRRVRPTQERVRQAIFNILSSRFPLKDIQVLDLFAGSGSLGLEALSRGAKRAVFVEPDPEARKALQENLRLSGFESQGRILKTPVARGLKILESEGASFAGVFLDPPYGQGLAHKTLLALPRSLILQAGAWVVVEHSIKEGIAESYSLLVLTDRRRYGTTWVSFYEYRPKNKEKA